MLAAHVPLRTVRLHGLDTLGFICNFWHFLNHARDNRHAMLSSSGKGAKVKVEPKPKPKSKPKPKAEPKPHETVEAADARVAAGIQLFQEALEEGDAAKWEEGAKLLTRPNAESLIPGDGSGDDDDDGMIMAETERASRAARSPPPSDGGCRRPRGVGHAARRHLARRATWRASRA